MGKLSELLSEYKSCPKGSSRESELIGDIYKIVDWMKENGHLTKPFNLPKKYGKREFGFKPTWDPTGKEFGEYCSHDGCNAKLPPNRKGCEPCPECGWATGCVWIGGVHEIVKEEDLNTSRSKGKSE